nr:type V CRISPR-associated protein Cas12b [Alicyclobacillus dauci]
MGVGGSGDVYLNLSLRVQNKSDARGERRPAYASLFKLVGDTNRAYVNFDRLQDYIEEHPDEGKFGSEGLRAGLRVMSVDLGLRTSASISVFRVAKKDELQPDLNGRAPTFYPIKEVDNLVAIHERSQLLKLPGETESKELRQIREQRLTALNKLRSQLTYLRQLVRCSSDDERRRERSWSRLTESSLDATDRMTEDWRIAFDAELEKLKELHGTCGDAEWIAAVNESIKVLWRHMGKQVRDWRKEVRSGDKIKVRGYARDVVGGNSIGQIDYLERQYKFLKSWSFFGKVSGQVIRAERGSRFAVTLRAHIDHAKEDRLKKLADRMIMEALGYVYCVNGRGKGEWVAKYPPCQFILLEELSEYRFHNDRPPSENNQLMQWSHRGVFEELKNQADMHDVLVGTMYSAFSSRFDARTGAPGVRCRRVPARCVRGNGSESLPWWLSKFVEDYKLDRSQLRPDDLIPTRDGEFFVSPFSADEGDLRQVHADLNAAQNLQRRLWSNFDISEIRVRCDWGEEAGEPILIPRVTSKRAAELYKNRIFMTNNNVTFYERDRGRSERKSFTRTTFLKRRWNCRTRLTKRGRNQLYCSAIRQASLTTGIGQFRRCFGPC